MIEREERGKAKSPFGENGRHQEIKEATTSFCFVAHYRAIAFDIRVLLHCMTHE